jgi:hypothetical protein
MPSTVTVLLNVYGNPITVGKVYRVLEWRKLGRRVGLYPRILGDDGRTITLDDRGHYDDGKPAPRRRRKSWTT